MKTEMKKDDEFYRYKIRRILRRYIYTDICEQLIHISYFDIKLWTLTKYLVEKNKLNVTVTRKLLKRKNPTYSQRKLFENKVKVLSELVDKTSSIHLYLRFYLELPRTEDEVVKLINVNQPKTIDFEVVVVQGMINHEILKIYRKVQGDIDRENEGMSRMDYLKGRPIEEIQTILKEHEEYDKKMLCRIKRVPC